MSCLTCEAIDKQKKLLTDDDTHFSMIKMLHLADLITELNGTTIRSVALLSSGTNASSRILRSHVYLFLYEILPWTPFCTRKSLGGVSVHALWAVL